MANDELRAVNVHLGTTRIARRAPWPRAAFALGIAVAAGAVEWAFAQPADDPRITVATILAEPASQAPLQIQVGPPNALPRNSFIRLQGLPASVSLTEGHSIAPGSWAVPLFGLSALKINVPAGVSGRSEIVIQLVAVDGTMLAERRTALVVGSASVIASLEKTPTEPKQKQTGVVPPAAVGRPLPDPPELSAEERVRAERLVAQGERHLARKAISGRRGCFSSGPRRPGSRGPQSGWRQPSTQPNSAVFRYRD